MTLRAFSLVCLGVLGARIALAQDKGPVVLAEKGAVVGGGAHLALAIGVNGFDDSHWPSLRFTADDAEQVAAFLDEHGQFSATVVKGSKG